MQCPTCGRPVAEHSAIDICRCQSDYFNGMGHDDLVATSSVWVEAHPETSVHFLRNYGVIPGRGECEYNRACRNVGRTLPAHDLLSSWEGLLMMGVDPEKIAIEALAMRISLTIEQARLLIELVERTR